MMGYAVLQVYHLSYQSKSRSNHFAFLNLVIPDSTAKLVLFDLVFFFFSEDILEKSFNLSMNLPCMYSEYHSEVFQAFNAPLDVITTTIIVWNIGMGGIFCIHWKGPLILQQAYLILISALAALTIIKFLPGWTTWTVLGVLIVWGRLLSFIALMPCIPEFMLTNLWNIAKYS